MTHRVEIDYDQAKDVYHLFNDSVDLYITSEALAKAKTDAEINRILGQLDRIRKQMCERVFNEASRTMTNLLPDINFLAREHFGLSRPEEGSNDEGTVRKTA